jgi:hypothetical protein
MKTSLKTSPTAGHKPWMKHMGKLKDLRKESARITRVIEEAFEQADEDMGTSKKLC